MEKHDINKYIEELTKAMEREGYELYDNSTRSMKKPCISIGI